MHDELKRAGLRRMRWWTFVLVVIGALGGSLAAAVVAFRPRLAWERELLLGGPRTLLWGALAGALGMVWLRLSATEGRAARRAWPRAGLTAAPDLDSVAVGAALARGMDPPTMWRLESDAPNVGCLPRRRRLHVIVTTAAERGLQRDELEALVALQMSLLLDGDAARVRRTLYVTSRAITWTLMIGLAAAAVGTLLNVLWAGLTINIAVWSMLIVIGLLALAQRRVRWAWGIISDAVALETTRFPAPLVRGLRRLASYNGPQVPVPRSWGGADPFWAAPVRRHVGVATMVVNGRARTRRSTEQVSDAALLMRAGIVERLGLGPRAHTLAEWQEAEAVFERLALYGGSGRGDGKIHGVEVTPAGAMAGALGPVSGRWGAG